MWFKWLIINFWKSENVPNGEINEIHGADTDKDSEKDSDMDAAWHHKATMNWADDIWDHGIRKQLYILFIISAVNNQPGKAYYPTFACDFQGFRVRWKFVFRTLELTDTPTNLANRVKVWHALDQSRSVQSHGPERAHQNNDQSWRSSRTDRRLSRQFRQLQTKRQLTSWRSVPKKPRTWVFIIQCGTLTYAVDMGSEPIEGDHNNILVYEMMQGGIPKS